MDDKISKAIASDIAADVWQVEAAMALLDDGATVPFISRYRKERTGGLNEVQIHRIEILAAEYRELEKRKSYICEVITTAGAMTDELQARINEADATTLEDIYLPYKPKRRTRATVARQHGLEPLARIIMSGNASDISHIAAKYITDEVADADAAIAGASDIIAEWVSENQRARDIVRSRFRRSAELRSLLVKGRDDEARNYRNYFDFKCRLSRIPSHNYLAIRRAERDGLLKVSFIADDDEIIDSLCRMFVKPKMSGQISEIVKAAVSDSYKRLIRPSIETELSAETKRRADDEAIAMFSDNARQLLLAPPLHGKHILAIDPGYRTGCKIVCLDSQGNLLHHGVIYPTPPQSDILGTTRTLQRLVDKYQIDAIALGNGTASRDTEKVLRAIVFPRPVEIFVVSENGASVYSASDIAREEFPDHDVTVRGAVSIGRRLIDPLAELVKIDPKSIGVGQYQHDVNQNALHDSLDFTVTSCVNSVGVNINTASRQLLAYVAGIGPQLATNIVAYRAAHGDFVEKRQILDVPRMGAKAFAQAAGFMRIPGGNSKLENTGVHPESYHIVKRMASDLGLTVDQLIDSPDKINAIDISRYIDDNAGEATLKDIIAELLKPGHDPRTSSNTIKFDPDIKELEDIREGMTLEGVVSNITAFGAFVDVGIHESGLVHISQMAERRISSPAQVVKINQIVRVRVLSVDLERRRLSLSMKNVPTQS
ncbi:MAG: RNA-binding transcriptional accessory protein [Muribaculaceae bacterium]|nr:RNA-binding transcriptional accessory protein [Muribaculaceae bacterium]